MNVRIISWFSCGAASAVATKLAIRKYGPERITIAYCGTNSEHPDNNRFMADCVKWFGLPVTCISSFEYRDTWDVWERRKYLAGINGAPCTSELKIGPRLAFQQPDDHHIFGYTEDAADVERFARFKANYFELSVEAPLIENRLNKAACLALIESAGIKPPVLYGLGYPNNNCLPCVKATSPDYWALVRKTHPEIFARMVELSRRLNVRLCRIKDERAFIDEIPADQPTLNPIAPACDFLCQLTEMDFSEAAQ